MKRLLFFIILLLGGISVKAQNYENSWVDFSPDREYYRMPISQTGIYRMYESDLISEGIDVSAFNPANIQVFYKGEELAIYVEEDAPGDLNFIEFYAEKNSGWLDAELYASDADQTNPYYSLINDTSSYFFTWNSSFNNRRLRETEYANFDEYESEEFCFYDTLIQYTNSYYYGVTDPEYRSGEGWFYRESQALSIGNSLDLFVQTQGVVNSTESAMLSYAIAGYSNTSHHLNVHLNNNLLNNDIYFGETGYTDTVSFSPALLSANTRITFSSVDDQGEVRDYSAPAFLRLTYPRNFNFAGQSQIFLRLKQADDTSCLVSFNGVDFQDALVYNLEKNTRSISAQSGSSQQVIIPRSAGSDNIIIADNNTLYKVSNIEEVNFTDFSSTNSQNNFIIISHKKLWEQANEYAQYRNALLVDVEELYHQFAYGIVKHPLAIKNFANFVYNTWDQKPAYIFLLGKAIIAESTRKNIANFENCLIPTYGNPPADNLFTAGLNNTVYEPLIPIGRLAAKDNNDVKYYLDKVREHEQAEPDEWMKQILHFGGGNSTSEQQTLANYLFGFENIVEDTLFGAHVSTFLKNSSEQIEITISDTIQNLINSGTAMLTFFGHAAASGFDQNIDDPSTYNNIGKYPFLLANSCYSGNIHLPESASVSERWTLIENKGVIAFLASTYLANAAFLNQYSSELYRNIAYKSYNQSIGKCVKRTVFDYVGDNYDDLNVKNTSLQFNLHGDPSVKIHSQELPSGKILVKLIEKVSVTALPIFVIIV